MDLKWITQMAERIKELEKENKRLKGLLEEQDNKQDPDMTKPQPCNMFDVADGEAWAKELGKHMYDVVRDVIYMMKRLSPKNSRRSSRSAPHGLPPSAMTKQSAANCIGV